MPVGSAVPLAAVRDIQSPVVPVLTMLETLAYLEAYPHRLKTEAEPKPLLHRDATDDEDLPLDAGAVRHYPDYPLIVVMNPFLDLGMVPSSFSKGGVIDC